MYTGSVRTASTHSSNSDDQPAALRVVAPRAKRPISGSRNVPQEPTALGFSDYLQDVLKLDAYQQARGDAALEDLIRLYHTNLAVTAQGPMHPAARAAKVDSTGEEDELELIDEQPRYTREQKGKSVEFSDSDQSLSSSPPTSSTTTSLFGEVPAFPTSGLTCDDIVFRIAHLNQEPPSRDAAQAILAKTFPSLVEPPARMFGEDGAPLLPTKKEEISPAERAARQEALKVELKGSKTHPLVKAIIVLESRNALWKRIASIDKAASDSTPLPLLAAQPLGHRDHPQGSRHQHHQVQDAQDLRAPAFQDGRCLSQVLRLR